MAVTATAQRGTNWTPARGFLVFAALYLIPLSLLGFFLNSRFPTSAAGAADSAYILGVLETNGWHNLAGLAYGVLALVAFLRPGTGRNAALFIGVSHVLVTVAFILWDPATFWVASNFADNVVHASFAVGGVIAGIATARTAD